MSGSVEIRAFQPTFPAGTLVAAPVTIPLAMPARVVNRIRIRIPPGPNGFMGFNIGSAGQQILPLVAGSWIIGSDEIIDWELTDQINSGAWEAHGYNTGKFDHTIYLQFEVQLPDIANAGSGVQPITSDVINAATPATPAIIVPTPPAAPVLT